MGKPSIFITRRLPAEVVEPYQEQLDIEMWPEEAEAVDRGTLLEKAGKVDGLVTMLTDRVDQELLNAGSRLGIVANMAVGYDNVDVKAAESVGTVITNTPDVLTETTADLTFSLLMAAARRIVEAGNYIKEDAWNHWSPLLLAGTDVHHKTIGIVGMGRIGEAVARRAKGFQMDVLYHNRSRKEDVEQDIGARYASFDELLKNADYVVSLAPLTDETHHMFNAEAFQKMKDTAIFINASRGALMNEKALEKALKDQQIAGAGLDVFEQEPIRSDHPLVSMPGVVCLPHIGSATKETRYNMMRLCLDNVVRYFEEKPLLSPVSQ